MSDSDDGSATDSGGSTCIVPGSRRCSDHSRERGDLTQFGCFDEDDDGTVVQKMKTIMALRESLGIDDDVQFNLEQEKKDKEKKRLAAMSSDERMAYEESQAGDVMSKIRAKHAEKLAEKQKEAEIARQQAEAERLEDERLAAEEEAAERAEMEAEMEAKRAAEARRKKEEEKGAAEGRKSTAPGETGKSDRRNRSGENQSGQRNHQNRIEGTEPRKVKRTNGRRHCLASCSYCVYRYAKRKSEDLVALCKVEFCRTILRNTRLVIGETYRTLYAHILTVMVVFHGGVPMLFRHLILGSLGERQSVFDPS
jgi:hypothetical protein